MNNLVISNPEKLEKIKKEIFKDGAEKLHILADFDKTLTTLFVHGEKVPSIISILRNGNYLTSDYAQKASELFNKYHPIEIDPGIPLKEKKKAMCEWWTNHFDLLIKSGLNKKDVKNAVKTRGVKFRNGFSDFIDFLKNQNIPLVIISAGGLGSMAISICLEQEKKLYDNIYIVSNSYEWDKEENAVAVKKPIIHTMNKDETAIQDFPVFEIIKNRKNVLLLGDGLGDAGMIDGFDYNNLIKIGFLNEKIEENLPSFKKVYDILALNDSSMDFVNTLLNSLIKK